MDDFLDRWETKQAMTGQAHDEFEAGLSTAQGVPKGWQSLVQAAIDRGTYNLNTLVNGPEPTRGPIAGPAKDTIQGATLGLHKKALPWRSSSNEVYRNNIENMNRELDRLMEIGGYDVSEKNRASDVAAIAHELTHDELDYYPMELNDQHAYMQSLAPDARFGYVESDTRVVPPETSQRIAEYLVSLQNKKRAPVE